MNLVAHRLHVGKFFVGLQRMVRGIALALPGVVNVDVSPAVVDEAGCRHRPRRAQDFLLIHRLRPAIPAVPAHRRRQRDPFSGDNAEIFTVFALRIFGVQHDRVVTLPFERARDASGRRVQRQAFRKFFHAECHRPVTRCGDGVKKRGVWPYAEDRRAVDARRGGRMADE